jgi:lysophospholipase L1-like esterase
VEPWAEIGGRQWYGANLDRVAVVVPDRPHDPDEVTRARGGHGGMQRTRTFHVSTGALRLRGGDPPDAATRIVVLGDSTAAGWGVDDDAAWPTLLQADLRAGGADVAVLNAGVPANPILTMRAWCEAVAPGLDPDVLLWVRRPEDVARGPLREYAASVRACQEAIGATVWVLLPPVATFDPYGAERWPKAAPELRTLLPERIPVRELTGPVREAQVGRGDVLQRAPDGGWQVYDQEAGAVVWTGAAHGDILPPALLQAMDRDPSLREALFFDDGHLDAEGQRWMAALVAGWLREAGLP